MTIEVTYKYKMSGLLESVDVLKRRSFKNVILKAEAYNKDADQEFWISQVTKVRPDGYRESVCLSRNDSPDRALVRVKESQPIRRSVWDDIYCISEEEEELLDLETWVKNFNGVHA
jgi:hypothetical protein